MAKFKNILDIIIIKKKTNCKIEIELTKDDIFKICEIHYNDKMSDYAIGYICNWINSYLKYHVPEIKVLLYNEHIYITDNLKVTYDNIHTRHPSSNMYKHKFDFEIKRLCETDFKYYKNCGISNTIVPECGVYIITTEDGQYVGSSVNICNRLRQHITSNHDEEYQQSFKKPLKIRNPIKLITIYECLGEDQARDLEKKIKSDLKPILNQV